MSTIEIITAVIAIYGALLSTVTFALHKLEKRQRIKVKLWLGFVAVGPSNPEDVVIMEAANAGSVAVHLSNCCIRLPDKQQFVARFHYDKPLPVTISPGESVQAFLASEKFMETLKKNDYPTIVTVSAEFSNKAGKVFRSKKETLNLDKLMFTKERNA